MFSEKQIQAIYANHVNLPDSYFRKYEKLPACPVPSWNYSWQNFDFPRNWCVLDFIEWANKYGTRTTGHLAYTCDTDPELEFITASKKTKLEYPPHDLHTIGNTYKNEFDFFIVNQTIEHLYNPFTAIKSIYETLTPGGYVFASVPTINIPHSTPIHYGGYNPMGLAMMFKEANFEILEIGQWGNYEYISRLFQTHMWPGYDMIQHDGIVTNERRNVAQCWILARKCV
uniref:Methyltransferase type 11 domain-containing protein n=1 Tax=viral metagenome TaxID=1070528 RepID=A0A6C0K171_9ZZZZ